MKQFLIIIFTFIIISGCKEHQPENKIVPGNKIPISDFFRNPEKTNFLISPDGKYYAYLAPFNKRMNIFVEEFGSENSVRITNETEQDINNYIWVSNDRILYLKDKTGDENYKLYGVNKDGSKTKLLTDFKGSIPSIIDVLENKPDEIIIRLNKREVSVFDAYRLNINTGEMTLEARNPGNIKSWITDHNGKIRLALASDKLNTEILYRENEKRTFRTIMTFGYTDVVKPEFFTSDNKNFYAISNLNRDKLAVVEIDPEKGEEVNVIYRNPDYDVNDVTYSNKRKSLEFATFYSWKLEYKIFDPKISKMMDILNKELSDYEISIVDKDRNEDKYIIRTYSDRSMGAYYLYDDSSKKVTILNEVSPWLLEKDLCKMKPVQYQARDGWTIHAYITLPKDKKPKDLPAVVIAHGGPWTRVMWGFEPVAQFFANRGFAVFMMNFRGSTGYGRKFVEASYKQWGLKLQDDITDGTKWLIKQGIADKNRVAIYGASFGGFAALAGATYTPDLYKCAVSYVGTSNLISYINSIPPVYRLVMVKLYNMIGHPVKDSAQLKATSPFYFTDKVKIPIFIAIGANDRWISKLETDIYVANLRKNGVTVQYMVKENEGHGYRKEENRIDLFTHIEKFLDKYLLGNNKTAAQNE